jgi:RNA polymerase sigma factor (TIGR02999 family)
MGGIPMGDVTRLLAEWNHGNSAALNELLGLVHAEMRRLAGQLLRQERTDHTLQPTELVHEAYLRLVGLQEVTFSGRAHFYGTAAGAMRRILVDHARHRNAHKRGGPHRQTVPLDQILNLPIDLRVDFERLDEALSELAELAPEQARVVDLRYFAGLSIEETAAILDVSPATIKRRWNFARAWLFRALASR